MVPPDSLSTIQDALFAQPPASESPTFAPKYKTEHRDRLPAAMYVLRGDPEPDPPLAMRPENHFDWKDGLRVGVGVHDIGREDDVVMHVIGLDSGPFGAKVDDQAELHQCLRRRVRTLFKGRVSEWSLRPELETVAKDGYVHHLYPLDRDTHRSILDEADVGELRSRISTP